jgi:hypothetical protein
VSRFILRALFTGSRSARIWRASFEKEEGRPYVDAEKGLFHRTWQGEHVPENKRAPVHGYRPACWLTCAAGVKWAHDMCANSQNSVGNAFSKGKILPR